MHRRCTGGPYRCAPVSQLLFHSLFASHELRLHLWCTRDEAPCNMWIRQHLLTASRWTYGARKTVAACQAVWSVSGFASPLHSAPTVQTSPKRRGWLWSISAPRVLCTQSEAVWSRSPTLVKHRGWAKRYGAAGAAKMREASKDETESTWVQKEINSETVKRKMQTLYKSIGVQGENTWFTIKGCAVHLLYTCGPLRCTRKKNSTVALRCGEKKRRTRVGITLAAEES